MPKFITTPLVVIGVAIAYVAISVHLYGEGVIQGRISGNHPLSQDFFTIVLPGLVALNAWIIASSFPPDWKLVTKWSVACIAAMTIAAFALMSFMCIAFNAYGS